MNKLTKLLIFLIAVQIFGQFATVEGKSKAKKGKAKAFGAGVLAGGLAGAAINHIMTRNNGPKEVHHYHHINDPNAGLSNPVKFNHVPSPPSKPTTIIEKGETLANGCYKQIVKEPDQYDVSKFTVTEQLICPQSVPLPANQPPVVPQVPVVVTQQPQPVVQPVAPQNINNSPQASNTSLNVSQVPPVYTAPISPLHPNPQIPTVSIMPAVPVVNPVTPSITVASVSPQVIILSRKIEFYGIEKHKKNAGGILFANIFNFLFSAVVILSLC